jgi:hypothetical protein
MARIVGRLALIALLPAAALAADEAGEEAKEEKKADGPLSKVYAQLGGVAGIPAFNIPSTQGQQNGWGMDVRAGYKLLSHLWLEGQWQWINRYETTTGFGTQANVMRTNTFTGNFKVPAFTGPIQIYGLLGFGFQNAALKHGDDKTEWAMRVGGGTNFFFTDHIGIYGEVVYLKPFGALDDFGTVPIAFGAIYQF